MNLLYHLKFPLHHHLVTNGAGARTPPASKHTSTISPVLVPSCCAAKSTDHRHALQLVVGVQPRHRHRARR
jgi:hypothetical protein